MRGESRAWHEISAPGTEIHWLLRSARELDGPTEEDRARVWARLSRVLGFKVRPRSRPFAS
jgi:hypothetical protein